MAEVYKGASEDKQSNTTLPANVTGSLNLLHSLYLSPFLLGNAICRVSFV